LPQNIAGKTQPLAVAPFFDFCDHTGSYVSNRLEIFLLHYWSNIGVVKRINLGSVKIKINVSSGTLGG
jgi:hypothetical protein